jgi:hypothetical protein
MTESELHSRHLQHAEWRVGFVRSLLEMHRHSIALHGAEWSREETILIDRLATAEAELQRLRSLQIA